ncbi:MAG: restriction endonuclease subunit S [Blautia wexlerae]
MADIALCTAGIIKLSRIPILEYVDNTYLKYYLLSPEFQKILNAKSSGGTVQGIKGSILHQQKIIYPSYEEQKKIGQHMDSLDHLITLHQRKPIPHPNHPIIHTKHKGEEKYVRIRVNDREKTNRTANLRRFSVDISGGFKN